MNIFVIPAVYPWKEKPGAGIFVYEQNVELSRRGHELSILDATELNYRNWTNNSCWSYSIEDTPSGTIFRHHLFGFMTSRFPRYSVVNSIRVLRKLYKIAEKEKGTPDLIIAHFTLPSGIAAMELAKESKIPFIIIEHYSLFLEKSLHPYISRKLKECVVNSNSFICVSNSLKDAIESKIGVYGKIKVIHNLIDGQFCYTPSPKTEQYNFFSAGNLTKNKRFDLLIKAFCRSFLPSDKVQLRIAGNGPELRMLEALIKKTNREHQILLVGQIDRGSMFDEYKHCNCFILLSMHETFGIVYREAMAVGRPIIATRNGGIEENWVDAYGILLDNDNIETISNALLDMCYSNKFDGKMISEMSMSLYSPKVVMYNLEKEIYTIIKRNGK